MSQSISAGAQPAEGSGILVERMKSKENIQIMMETVPTEITGDKKSDWSCTKGTGGRTE